MGIVEVDSCNRTYQKLIELLEESKMLRNYRVKKGYIENQL